MNDVIKWKRDYLQELEIFCSFSPDRFDSVFEAEKRLVYNSAKERYKEDFDSYLYLAYVEYATPLLYGYIHFATNHPIEYSDLLNRISNELGFDLTIPKQFSGSDEDLLYSLSHMSRYGLHLLLSHYRFSDLDEEIVLRDIQYQDVHAFQNFCAKHPGTFAQLKQVLGYFNFLDKIRVQLDITDNENNGIGDTLLLLGISPERYRQSLKSILDESNYGYSKLNDEQIEGAALFVAAAFNMYVAASIMDDYEKKIVDEVLTIPEYSMFSCAAQLLYLNLFGSLPVDLMPLITEHENARLETVKSQPETNKATSGNATQSLELPEDFFTNSDYVDGNILTIKSLSERVTIAKSSSFAAVINLLATSGYIEPSLDNRRLLASTLSGRRLKDWSIDYTEKVKWLEKRNRSLNRTEQVMLWLCKFFFHGGYSEAYSVFGIQRTIKEGAETPNTKYADKPLQDKIEKLYPQKESNN